MKARIPMPKPYRADASAYVQQEVEKRLREQQLLIIMRTMKLAIATLHDEFGFGNQRVMRFIAEVNRLTKEMNDDFTGWYKIDKIVIDECGVRCDREDYDKLEEVWKKEHKNDKSVKTLEDKNEL